VGNEVSSFIRVFSDQKHVEIAEMSVQPDHVHVIAMIPQKISFSDLRGIVKGRTAIHVFYRFRDLKKNPIGVTILGPKATAMMLPITK
jgi:putative transposase